MLQFWKNSIRLLGLRYQKQLSIAYVVFLMLLFIMPILYLNYVPFNLDYGIPIFLRSLAYRHTFDKVDRAEYLIQKGDYLSAEKILLSYISTYSGVKAGQLRTHAYVKACDLLSDIYMNSQKLKKAIKFKKAAIDILPLSYFHWYELGKLYLKKGDIVNAVKALNRSFKLAPNNPEVFNLYAKSLFEIMDYAKLLWAYDQFIRSQKRIRPILSISLGIHRSKVQEKLLEICGVPIKGKYLRVLRFKNLQRTARASIEIPEMFFKNWSYKKCYLLLEFENIFEDIKINKLAFIYSDNKVLKLDSNSIKVNYMGQKNSGGKKSFEITIPFELKGVKKAIITFSLLSYHISPEITKMIHKAKLNMVALQ